MLYLLVILVILTSYSMAIYLKSLKRQEIVLRKVRQVRRDSMIFLYDNWISMQKDEYIALVDLIRILETSLVKYAECKSTLFNFKKLLLCIKEYDYLSYKVKRSKISENKEIRKLYSSAFIAYSYGFCLYAPIIKPKISISLSMSFMSISANLGLDRLSCSFHQVIRTISSVYYKPSKLDLSY